MGWVSEGKESLMMILQSLIVFVVDMVVALFCISRRLLSSSKSIQIANVAVSQVDA